MRAFSAQANMLAAMLELNSQRDAAIDAARNLHEGAVRRAGEDPEKIERADEELEAAEALAEEMHKKATKRLKKEAKADKPVSKRKQKIIDTFAEVEGYKPAFKFAEGWEAAHDALFKSYDKDDWLTPKAGKEGSNYKKSLHCTQEGDCYMITCNKLKRNGVEAILHEATDNENGLPFVMEGGTKMGGNDSGPEDNEEEYMQDVDLLLAPTGKKYKDVHGGTRAETEAFVSEAAKNRDVKAAEVTRVAQKWGCPTDVNNKKERIFWLVFQSPLSSAD